MILLVYLVIFFPFFNFCYLKQLYFLYIRREHDFILFVVSFWPWFFEMRSQNEK